MNAAIEILCRKGIRTLQNLLQGSLRHQGPATRAGSGTQIQNVVSGADGVLVMLHNDHRVSQITKITESLDQPIIVPLVQTDTGFIEHVEDARKPRSDLRGQPDTLGLTAGESAALATELKVTEADFIEKPKTLANFPKDIFHDLHITRSDLKFVHRTGSLSDGEPAHFLNAKLTTIQCAECHRENFRL